MRNILYYHFYCSDEEKIWRDILFEQMAQIEESKLIHNLKKIEVTAIVQNQTVLNRLIDQFGRYKIQINIDPVKNPYQNDKEMIASINHNSTITENHTMRKIYNDCLKNTDAYNICYIHSKGITSHLKDNEERQRMYKLWRQYLNWGVIENWKKCVDALDENDIAGVNFYETPSAHYSGNFWWSRSEHVRKLPDPSTKYWWKTLKETSEDHWLKTVCDRFRDEQWPCSIPGTRAYNIYTHAKNPASVIVEREEYVKNI